MRRLKDESEPDHVEDKTIQAYQAKNHTANGQFRGTKADIWEAGHHVPFFAAWPGRIEAGSRCEHPICLTDVFATLAEVTGTPLKRESAPDSFSLLPLMRGGEWSSPRAPVIHHSAAGMFAIREGDWKLVLGNGSGGRELPRGKPFARPYRLFHLASDIGETTDVSSRHPEIVARMEKKCREIIEKGRSRP